MEIKGGAKLERRLAEIAAKAKNAAEVRVGFFAGSTEPDGVPVPLNAAWQEFGTSRIPPRPFFRRMIAAKSSSWPAAVEGLLKANGYDASKTLEMVGEGIAGQLKQSIIDFTDPPNAPSTIKKKGFDKPLVDTATMLHSVGVQVK